MRALSPLASGLVVLTTALSAGAQSLDEATTLYKKQSYEQAAISLYDVLLNDADTEHRDQAEIYLAETLRKSGYAIPALFYYSDIFKAGKANRYYLNAVEGLLEVQTLLHDPLFVPTLLNANFDAESFSQLDP